MIQVQINPLLRFKTYSLINSRPMWFLPAQNCEWSLSILSLYLQEFHKAASSDWQDLVFQLSASFDQLLNLKNTIILFLNNNLSSDIILGHNLLFFILDNHQKSVYAKHFMNIKLLIKCSSLHVLNLQHLHLQNKNHIVKDI